ncbi:hypothetical protein V1478_001666 [Vespula squamosa]|uniref:Uncharacterized protein n=1 Tax=Vespula squamosa TaxID=30214 RepID=A0ABD2BZ41_VESSQ
MLRIAHDLPHFMFAVIAFGAMLTSLKVKPPAWTSASFDIFVFDVYEYVDNGRHILCKYQNCIPYNSLQYSKLETILLYHSH